MSPQLIQNLLQLIIPVSMTATSLGRLGIHPGRVICNVDVV